MQKDERLCLNYALLEPRNAIFCVSTWHANASCLQTTVGIQPCRLKPDPPPFHPDAKIQCWGVPIKLGMLLGTVCGRSVKCFRVDEMLLRGKESMIWWLESMHIWFLTKSHLVLYRLDGDWLLSARVVPNWYIYIYICRLQIRDSASWERTLNHRARKEIDKILQCAKVSQKRSSHESAKLSENFSSVFW